MNKALLVSFLIAAAYLSAPQPALAYVGPGSGIAVIGAALAFVAGILLAIVGFVWYPLKRLWRKATGGSKTENAQVDSRSH